jgi:Protein of unknown function (DUF1565)/Right handed beta helix region
MRNHLTKEARRRRGLASHALFALAMAALAGCADNDPTGPEALAGEPVEMGKLTANQSPVDLAPSGSLSVAATRAPRSFFVNPTSGKDTNPGTKALPFKTLARALSTAIGSDTVRLASGDYGAAFNGERFTNGSQQVPVPAGVMILGTPAGELTSHLHGSAGDVGLNFQGGATVRNVVLSGFTTGIRATQGVQSLKSLLLNQNQVGLELGGSAKATLVGSTIVLAPALVSNGVRVLVQAQFIMDGGVITGTGLNCDVQATGVSLFDRGRVTLKNFARIAGIAGNALRMGQNSKATLTSFSTIERNFGQLPGCAPLPSVLARDSASLTLRKARVFGNAGTKSVGIQLQSRAPLTLDSAHIKGHTGAGISTFGNAKIVASGTRFDGNIIGIDAKLTPNASITITRSTVVGNITGIRAPFFKLRNSIVSGNQTGVVLTSIFSDLGQTFDPGNNTITSNTITGVTFDADVGSGLISASGNTWNAGTQDSDESGHYTDKPLLNSLSPFASGKNFVLPAGNYQIQL